MHNKQADRGPGILTTLFHPAAVGRLKGKGEDGSLSADQQLADLTAKMAGGVLLAALWQGHRKMRGRGKDPADSLDESTKRQLAKQQATEFVSIPGVESPSVYREIMERAGREKTAEEGGGIVDTAKGWGEDASSWLQDKRFKDIPFIRTLFTGKTTLPGIVEGLTVEPSWHVPVATATIMASALVANRQLAGKVDVHKKEKKEEDIDRVRRQIGQLVQDELRHTRGMGKTAEGEGTWSKIWDMVKKSPRLYGALQASLLITGLYVGFQRGKQDSPERALRSQLKDRIEKERAADRPPQVIIPKEHYYAGGDIMGEETGTQEHVRIPDLTV